MASGSTLEKPSSDQHFGITTTAPYEFTKSFVSAAKAKFGKLKEETSLNTLSEVISQPSINTKGEVEPLIFQVSITHKSSLSNRTKFIDDLHKQLQTGTAKPIIFVVAGTGGVGKTAVVRKYIERHHQNYDHVIWIDAQNCAASAQSQFRYLASSKMQIQSDSQTSPHNHNHPAFSNLREQVYERLCRNQARVLLVLDSVELNSDQRDAAEQTNAIKSLLPQSLPVSYIYPTVLVTSRQTKWNEKIFQTIYLDLWTEEEFVGFLLEKLELPPTQENKATAADLGTRFGFGPLPIAMQSAVSIIVKELKRNQDKGAASSFSYGIQDLIHDYDREKNSSFPDQEFQLWNVSFKKILESCNGELAIQIICFMAYLSPNAIPTGFLLALFQDNNEINCINDALALLTEYSLITFCGSHYTIHKIIQKAVIQNLKLKTNKSVVFNHATFQNEIQVLTKLSQQLEDYLCTLIDADILAETFFHVIANILHVTTSHLVSEKLLIPECRDMTESLANIMNETWNYDEALSLYTKVLNSLDPLADVESRQYLEIKDKMGQVLESKGKYEEELELYSEMLQVKMYIFGSYHCSTLETQTKIIDVLQRLGREDEASEKLKEIKPAIKRITIHHDHEDDPAALLAVKFNFAFAYLHSNLEDCSGSDVLALFQDVLEQEEKSAEPDHGSILTTQFCIAETLLKQGGEQEVDNAVQLYCKVQTSAIEKLGRTNEHTLKYRKNYAHALVTQGNLERALEVYVGVLKDEESLKESLHADASVSVTKHNISAVLTDLGENDKAVQILVSLRDSQLDKYGSDHPLTLDTMFQLGRILCNQEKFAESLDVYDKLLESQIENLGPCHSDTLLTKLQMGWVYFFQEEYDNSKIIALDLLSTKKVTGNESPKFDYPQVEELLSKTLDEFRMRTHIRRRIKSVFYFRRV